MAYVLVARSLHTKSLNELNPGEGEKYGIEIKPSIRLWLDRHVAALYNFLAESAPATTLPDAFNGCSRMMETQPSTSVMVHLTLLQNYPLDALRARIKSLISCEGEGEDNPYHTIRRMHSCGGV
jgi:hypothetical protein